MQRMIGCAKAMAVALCCAGLLGCPSGGGGGTLPNLVVTPVALNFGSNGTQETLSIFNNGAGAVAWTLTENIAWLSANTTSGTVTSEIDHAKLTVDRDGLAPGTYNGLVVVSSASGTRNVNVAMTVAGDPGLEVDPGTINFLNNQETAQFTITNNGEGPLTWNISLQDSDDPSDTIPFPAYLTIDPDGGTTAVGDSTVVTVEIDRELLDEGVFGFVLLIESNGGDAQVAVNITQGLSAEISAEPTVLDFGMTENTLSFDVFNSGEPGSVLDFTLSTDRPDLIFFDPAEGTSVGTNNPLNYDRVPISVTIDRNALTGSVDGGTITIAGLGVDSVDVVINIEAAPLGFEGAQNRSRPPFILRFVFLMRDALGNAIDTTDADVFDELSAGFTIEEDGIPLDTDETSLFVTNAEGLRYNLALMLDYTGSMYSAGAGNGSVIEQMVNASADFIDDVPASYRLALMEYHDRQQANRLVHNFSTSKDSLKDALQAFSVPFGDNGASEVYDAVMDGVARIANEDIGALPFDDADVRALIFVSDGRDTSSIASLDETITHAVNNRVRLYPIGFGQNVNAAPLIQLATETGGHYYAAPTAAELVNLLQSEAGAPGNAPGLIITELQRQLVLTYVSLFQEGSHNYLVSAEYDGISGSFQRDAVFATGGDVRAGQLSLRTAGIQPDGTAELFVRSEYVPRNVSQIKVKFISGVPITVELDPNGLISDWFLVDNGGGVFTALTSETTPLTYGSFGNLFRVRYTGLNTTDVLPLAFRVDNQVYVNPPFTKFFQYPEGIVVQEGSAQESEVPIQIADGFDPDALDAWDRDVDSVPDFDDLFPDDPNQS
ncbi:MAG: VWA domain-containing protein [Candidatus Hydrogenedentes bacterium]|nr:VWA domain-containing protein [Candidatus Hydrogenedentota bacterium]